MADSFTSTMRRRRIYSRKCFAPRLRAPPLASRRPFAYRTSTGPRPGPGMDLRLPRAIFPLPGE